MTRENNAPRSLARRVSGWTSNLLATGIVLAAAVGVGRQLSEWWRIDPAGEGAAMATPAVGPGAVGESGEQPFQLTFGAGYSLRRIEMAGDLTAAVERLRGECRAIAESGRVPKQPPSESEQRFLSRTHERTPLEERPGAWQIHQFEGKLPLLVTVRTAESGRGTDRVVAWGLAMPTDEEACTLLVYEAGGAAEEKSLTGEIALPASLRRTVTLSSQGETSIGLTGDSSPRRAGGDLDVFLTSRGWASSGWRQIGGAWHNRYWARNRAATSPTTIDVRLSDDGRGGLVGLLIIFDYWPRPLTSDH